MTKEHWIYMDTLLVPLKIALMAKLKGFNESCFGLYLHTTSTFFQQVESQTDHPSQICSAPTHQQLINWLREKHNIKINPTGFFKNIHSFEIRKSGTKEGRKLIRICDETLSYADAQNKAIEEALKLIKDL